MIDILIYVAIALVVVVAALLAYAAAKPDTFRVQRATGINAPAERIFPLIANLKSMNMESVRRAGPGDQDRIQRPGQRPGRRPHLERQQQGR